MIIRNGTVYDAVSDQPYKADIQIKNGKIGKALLDTTVTGIAFEMGVVNADIVEALKMNDASANDWLVHLGNLVTSR